MASNSSDQRYFTHQEYSEVKSSFVYKPGKKIDISLLKDIIQSIHNTPKKELMLHDTFYQLMNLVNRHHSSIVYYTDRCCNYINYWLNKTIRDSNYGVNKENIKFFDDFKKAGRNNRTGIFNCIPNLRYMETDAFQKMKSLYDLYDYLTELQQKDHSLLCKNITDLAEMYNIVMQKYKGKDINLFNALTDLKKVIETDKLDSKKKCGKDTFDLLLLKMDPPQGKEQNAKTTQAHAWNYGKTLTPNPFSGSSSHGHGLIKKEENEREQTSSGKPELSKSSRTQPASDLRQGKLQDQLQEQERHLDALENANSFKPNKGDISPEEGNPSAYSIFPTFDRARIMETIKGAASNVLESVQRVPLISIFCCIGAFFLLYKYTPVGYLFKRRKRRKRPKRRKKNISNFFYPAYGQQFAGYYPEYYNQDFQNYQMNIAYYPALGTLQ